MKSFQTLSESPQRVVSDEILILLASWILMKFMNHGPMKQSPLSVWVSYFILQQIQQRTKCSKGKNMFQTSILGWNTYVSPKPFWDYIVGVQIPSEMAPPLRRFVDRPATTASKPMTLERFPMRCTTFSWWVALNVCSISFHQGFYGVNLLRFFVCWPCQKDILLQVWIIGGGFLIFLGGIFLSSRKRGKMNPFGWIWFKELMIHSPAGQFFMINLWGYFENPYTGISGPFIKAMMISMLKFF